MPAPVTFQEHGGGPGGVAHQGVLPAAEAPVVELGPLPEGEGLHDLVDAEVPAELPLFLPGPDDLPQQLEVDPVPVQQMLLAPGQELGGEQPGQKVDGDAGLDHHVELMIEQDQLVHGILRGGQGLGALQLLILLIEDVGQGPHQGILPVKVVVEGALGGLGLEDDVLHRGVVVALLVEELPGGGDDAPPGVAAVFSGHGAAPFPCFGSPQHTIKKGKAQTLPSRSRKSIFCMVYGTISVAVR